MATTIKSLPKFYVLTSSAYKSLASKDANTIYFVSDANGGTLYKGDVLYGASVKYVTSAPAAADCVIGELYINTTNGLAYVKSDASTVIPVGVLTTSSIDGSTDGDLVPNVSAVRGYAIPLSDKTAAITSTTTSTLIPTVGAVTNYIDTRLAAVLVFKGVVDTLSLLPLTGNKKGDMYLVKNDGTDTNVEYVWTADTASGTLEDWEKLGPSMDLSGFMSKVAGAVSGNLAGLDANGQATDAGVKAGSSAFATTPAANVLATEKAANDAIVAASSALDSKVTAASGTLNDRITTVSSALNDSIVATSSALDSKVTAASAALDVKIDSRVIDSGVNTTGQVVVTAADGAVKDGGVTVGAGTFAPTTGTNYQSGAVYSETVLATEAAVVDLINQLAWVTNA